MCFVGLLAPALLAVGCGGGNGGGGGEARPKPRVVNRQDAQAKSDARTLVTEVEACFVDSQDYAGCDKPPGTKLPIGRGEGQVQLTKASANGYTVVARSKSGKTFTVSKTSSRMKRSCEAAQFDGGGCKGGTW